jgi:uncharacterized protein YcfJ
MSGYPTPLLVLALLLATASSAQTQSNDSFRPHPSSIKFTEAAPSRFAVEVPRSESITGHRQTSRRTHWADGAIVGAILTGILSGYLAHGLCGMSDEAHHSCTGALLGGAAIGAVIGGTLGGLIGGLFPEE